MAANQQLTDRTPVFFVAASNLFILICDLPSQYAAPGGRVIVLSSNCAASYDRGAGSDPAPGRIAARVREPLGPGIRVTAPGEAEGPAARSTACRRAWRRTIAYAC